MSSICQVSAFALALTSNLPMRYMSRWPESNRRPTVYKTVALPLSYTGLSRQNICLLTQRTGLHFSLLPKDSKAKHSFYFCQQSKTIIFLFFITAPATIKSPPIFCNNEFQFVSAHTGRQHQGSLFHKSKDILQSIASSRARPIQNRAKYRSTKQNLWLNTE